MIANAPQFCDGQRVRYIGHDWSMESLETGDVVEVMNPFSVATSSGNVLLVQHTGYKGQRPIGVYEHHLEALPSGNTHAQDGLSQVGLDTLIRHMSEAHNLQSLLAQTRDVAENELQWHRGARTAYQDMMETLTELRRNHD